MITDGADGAVGAQAQRLGAQAEHDLGAARRAAVAATTASGSGTERAREGDGHWPGRRRRPGRPALDERPLDQVHARAAEEVRHERVGRPGVERPRASPPAAADRRSSRRCGAPSSSPRPGRG